MDAGLRHGSTTTSASARGRALLVAAAMVASCLALLGTASGSASAADPTPLTLTVSRITQPDDSIDSGPLQGPWGDFYAGATLGGSGRLDNFGNRLDNGFEFGVGYIFPATFSLPAAEWTFTTNVDRDAGDVEVTLEIWDNDDCDEPFCTDPGLFQNADDQADVKPGPGRTLVLAVNPTTGRWTGDLTWPENCAGGTESDRATVCFDIFPWSPASGDADGDGLLDAWERDGFDADGDGTVDVDLPGLGADPAHKDLFLELDHEAGQAPTRADVQAMKAAFRSAPLTNPDGIDGVDLWVDTGPLVDADAREGQPGGTCSDAVDNGGDGLRDGADPDCVFLDASVEDPAAGTCADGVNNDADALVDAADPDCLVGDDLGGGSTVPTIGACNLDRTWYAAKRTNFNADDRRWIFRYATSLALASGCPSSGGWGEIGGNDFMDFNHDGGTLLHELGHTLNLRHGGNEDANCKPNYVSGMNYDNQFGINRAGGGTILDLSPPRSALNGSSRGSAPLGDLRENDLDDGVVLDSTDPANRYVFVNPAGAKVQANLNTGANWNSDTDPPGEADQTVNIDTNATGGGPVACADTATTSTLEGFDDWKQVSLPFRQFGDSADGAINPVTTPEPRLSELQQLRTALNTTDLAVTLTDDPDPVAAGRAITYTLTVRNDGPNPASSVRLVHDLPPGTTVRSTPTGCSLATSTLTCSLGEVTAHATRTLTLIADVPSDLVYRNGGPVTATSTARVTNLAGPDPHPADNTATATTRVIAEADVSIQGTTASAPRDVLIGQPAALSLNTTLANAGPSSPIDARVTTTASGVTPGLTVTPTTRTDAANALTTSARRVLDMPYTVSCTTPGAKQLTFDHVLALSKTADVDPDASDNTASTTVRLECIIPIAINIRPGGHPNSINLNTDATLAALTTRAGEYGLPLAFDATTIDIGTVRFGVRSALFDVATVTGAREIHERNHLEDAVELDERTRDRDRDGVQHYKPSDSGLTLGTTQGCLKGRLSGTGHAFLGCDSVAVVN